VKERRWDDDERGRGVADGSAFVPGVRQLADALGEENWIAEDPELHLLPHIERACAAAGLEVLGHEHDDAVFVVRIAGGREACEAVYSVIGAFAESATSIRQRGLTFEVATGLLDEDTHFKSHGHLVRLELVPPA